ncbi:hypothetical protein HanPI659440_Chr08g0286821 [Helianthus annuus]|nr:hypothetical protein HanPI659440_Chr08g0286821 [Helianthus annuus]
MGQNGLKSNDEKARTGQCGSREKTEWVKLGETGTTLAWTKHGRLTGQDEASKRV